MSLQFSGSCVASSILGSSHKYISRVKENVDSAKHGWRKDFQEKLRFSEDFTMLATTAVKLDARVCFILLRKMGKDSLKIN